MQDLPAAFWRNSLAFLALLYCHHLDVQFDGNYMYVGKKHLYNVYSVSLTCSRFGRVLFLQTVEITCLKRQENINVNHKKVELHTHRWRKKAKQTSHLLPIWLKKIPFLH